MEYILHIETATKSCSVGLSEKGKLISIREQADQGYSHARLLTVFIDELLRSAELSFDDLSAVSVNKGPGSYTGLRIGVSAAKGICYAKDIPLVTVNSLFSMANQCIVENKNHIAQITQNKPFYLCPMIDARRMEVYTAIYDNEMKEISGVKAVIIDDKSFAEKIKERVFFIFGDGADKCAEVLKHPNLHLIPDFIASARGQVLPVYKKFINKEFEDVAYFEPFYLKDFVAGKPSVKGLH